MGTVTEELKAAYPHTAWADVSRNDAALGVVGNEYVFVCVADDEYMAEDSRGVSSFGQTPISAVMCLSNFSAIAMCVACGVKHDKTAST